jgi:hypothetical protein
MVVELSPAGLLSSELVGQALFSLLREHNYWCSGSKEVVVCMEEGGEMHRMARYHADWEEPRPESFGWVGAMGRKGTWWQCIISNGVIICTLLHRHLLTLVIHPFAHSHPCLVH